MKNSLQISDINPEIIKVLQELTPLYGPMYLVGGAIRDILNQTVPEDYDILVEQPPDEIIKTLKVKHSVKIAKLENRVTPIIRLNLDDRFIVDLSHLEGDLEENLVNRDFTVNSLAVNINKLIKSGDALIIDKFNGIKHAQDRILVPTSDDSLKNDPLRILRGFRIKLYNNYVISNTLLRDIDKYRELVADLRGERIWRELDKILKHNDSYRIFFEIIDNKILDKLFDRKIVEMKEFSHDKPPAKTLLEHSLFTYKQLENFINHDLRLYPGKPNYFNISVLKLSAFLHDIGKLYTKKIMNDKKIHFHNHEIIGSEITSKIVKNKLSFSNINTKYATILVKNHMRPHLFTRIPKLSDHAIYRFIRDCKGYTDDVITLSIADALSTNSKIDKLLHVARQVNDYVKKNSKEEVKSLLDGNEIMDILSIPPSSFIAKIKSELIAGQINGYITSKEEAKAYIEKKYEKFKN